MSLVKRWGLFLLGWALVLLGGLVADRVQTSGGVEVSEVRVPLLSGEGSLGALLYTPPGASAADPAPGVLAVHGYINTRETQSPFAIEYARRGYVVLAPSQTGHGFSDGVAFEEGFGGPAALAYLRGLPFVDADRIGLEGHSMGGWTVLAAATAMPDAYRSVVLVGSSTGAPFAQEATPDWPRNLAVVYGTHDEFSELMWGVPEGDAITRSGKLAAAFGAETPVEPERLYGDLDAGTARRLAVPPATHPGEHLSFGAVDAALDWTARTVGPGIGTAPSGQVWLYKELATLAALVGGVLVAIGTLTALAPVRSEPGAPAARPPAWLVGLALVVPAVSYFPLTGIGGLAMATPLFPQAVTNHVLSWVVLNTVFAAAALAAARHWREPSPGRAAFLALAAASATYLAALLLDLAFLADMRFWVFGWKLLRWEDALPFAVYLVPFTAFFYASQKAALAGGSGRGRLVLLSAGGVAALCALVYGWLGLSGALPGWADPLFSIVLIQFVPVLAVTGLIAAIAHRRTGGALTGALLSSLLVTWYVVAGQATHA